MMFDREVIERACRDNPSRIVGILTGRDSETGATCTVTRHEDGSYTVIKLDIPPER